MSETCPQVEVVPVHRFNPVPVYSSEWWSTLEYQDLNPFHAAHGMIGCTVTAGAWVARSCLHAEIASPVGGYLDIFPTATDLLLWVRWCVLPASQDHRVRTMDETFRGADVSLTGEAKQLAAVIDGAPPGSAAIGILKEFKPDLQQPWGRMGFEILEIQSIHDCLSDWGTIEEIREILGTGEVQCVDGRWTMPEWAWEEMGHRLNAMEW